MSGFSIYDQGLPAPCPRPFNMADYVLTAGRATPNKPALEILSPNHTQIWTYDALRRAVLGTASGLLDAGLHQGDRLMLQIGNQVDFPILFLGAIAVGIVPVPVSAQLTAAELRPLIADLAPAMIAFGAGVARLSNLPCPAIGHKEIANMRALPAAKIITGDPDRLAYIIFTSGNSGHPHGVMHAHRAVWARRMMWTGWYDLRADERLLHAGAFNWTYTLGTGLCDPWAIGATALIPDEHVDRATLARLLASHNATIFAASPGVYRQILKSGAPLALPALRHALSAGEKLPITVKTAWETATGRPIFEALGLSEISTFISSSPAYPSNGVTTGRPQKGRRVAVLDRKTLKPVKLLQAGILAVSNRDPGLMLGYRAEPRAMAAKYTGEWFLTGDMVSMDEKANITYLGRRDDMMNAGGYRVSPLEVESVLNAHPHISDSAAVSVEIKPDTFVIAAFYQSDIELEESALADHCAAGLARYKCPRVFTRLKALPRGANNKLRRGVLRDRFKESE